MMNPDMKEDATGTSPDAKADQMGNSPDQGGDNASEAFMQPLQMMAAMLDGIKDQAPPAAVQKLQEVMQGYQDFLGVLTGGGKEQTAPAANVQGVSDAQVAGGGPVKPAM